jgi:endoglucanase
MKAFPFALTVALLTACSTGSGSSIPVGYSLVPAVSPAPAAKAITSFTVTGSRGTVNRFDRTVKLYLPEGSDLSSLTPTITLASGYTISPASGTAVDLSGSQTVTYTVTKGSASTDYTVEAFNTAPTAATVDGWLGRGINLGNDLDAWPGDEGSWTSGVVAKEYFFDDYLSLGFNSVRIPITWGASTTPRLSNNGASSTISTSFMNRVDGIAGWGIDRGLAVVINAHHEDWIRAQTGTTFTNALPRFEALWTQIANHFKDWPPQLVFEILNEPQGNIKESEVNTLNADILNIIRTSGGNNATRTVIIGAYQYNSLYALTTTSAASGDTTFAIPSDGATPHLIANFHDYNPWTFAGQASGKWGTTNDTTTAASDINTVIAWSQNNGNIPLYMGEFGAVLQYQGKKIDAASRVTWYTTMAKLARDNNIAAVAWDDFGDFKLYDRVDRAFETTIQKAILPP